MNYQLVPRVPLLYQLAHLLIRWDVPGAWTAYENLILRHLEGRAASFRLSDGSQIWVPLTWPGMITGRALTGYEPQAIRYFAAQIAAAPAPVTLIDCGADIGVFTRLVLSKTVNVDRIIAYEPNPTSFTLLEQNLLIMEGAERFSLIARAAAVSAVPGRAHLDIDTRYDNAHGAFITATPSGEPYHESIPVEVETIDQLEISPDSPVALKIDIEGEEINALKGAARVLRECPYFVVQFEAHPQVAERTKTDPSECLAYLEGMGAEESCAFCERTGDIVSGLTADRPFFSQVDAAEIYDVVAVHAAGLRR